MVADPGPDVLFPDLTCKYVVAADSVLPCAVQFRLRPVRSDRAIALSRSAGSPFRECGKGIVLTA
jgi:hypothetical protein